MCSGNKWMHTVYCEVANNQLAWQKNWHPIYSQSVVLAGCSWFERATRTPIFSWGLAPIFLSVDDIFNFLPQLILVVIRWLQSSIMLQWLSYCLPIVCPPVELTESYLGFYFVPTLEKLSCRVSSQPHDMSFWLLHGVLVLWCVGVFVCVELLHFLWWCLISTG